MTKLNTSFARAPRVRPKDAPSDWQPVEPYTLGTATFLIAVDEFAEAELPGLVALSREELQAICDQAQTKERILEALRR